MKNIKIIVGVIIIVVVVGVAVDVTSEFIKFKNQINNVQPKNKYHANGIVVLTGDANRIPNALELLSNHSQAKLLISGVNPNTNEDDIKNLNASKKNLFECCVEIGHNAKNTRGNARETKKWVMQNNIQTLVIVTSDYHIPRAMSEFKQEMPDVTLVPHPVRTEQKWSLIVPEFIKYYVAR